MSWLLRARREKENIKCEVRRCLQAANNLSILFITVAKGEILV